MNGLASQGVEAYFPLSPKIMLVMADGEYHDFLQKYERRIIKVKNVENVKYYNSYALFHCDSRIFSNSDDFGIAEEIIKKNPDVFKQPRITIN